MRKSVISEHLEKFLEDKKQMGFDLKRNTV